MAIASSKSSGKHRRIIGSLVYQTRFMLLLSDLFCLCSATDALLNTAATLPRAIADPVDVHRPPSSQELQARLHACTAAEPDDTSMPKTRHEAV